MNPRWLALLAAAMAAAGCAGDERREPSAQPVSVPRAAQAPKHEPSGQGGVPAKDLDQALGAMSSAIQGGDYERALALGDQMLRRKPNEEQKEQIERLRKVAKQHLLQTFYVDAVVRAEKDRVTIGEPIKGEVTLINVGTEQVVIEDEASGGGPQGTSRTLLRLEVGYREFVPDGTLVRQTLTSNVVVGRRITIAPAHRYSIPMELDTLTQNPGGTMLRHYDVGGTVFLAELRAGKETIYGQLKLKPRRVQVFPKNWEHLAQRPVEKLAEAIRKHSPTHVPLAAALVPDGEKRAALAVIRDALRPSGGADLATQTACCVALVILTGEERPADAAAWLPRLDELLS
jgi:hypothetical protein